MDRTIVSILTVLFLLLGFVNQAQGQQGNKSLENLLISAEKADMNQAKLNNITSRAESKGINGRQLYDILAPAVAMAEQDLPYETALDKALEGLSKGVSTERIASFLTELQGSTEKAAHIVQTWTDEQSSAGISNSAESFVSKGNHKDELVTQIARGIRNNVDDDTYTSVLSDISGDEELSKTSPAKVIAAISIIPELPGTAAEQAKIARSFIIQALKSGFTPPDLQQLPIALSQAQSHAQLPAASILSGASRQMAMGTPAAAILQNLFNGNIGGGPPGNTPPGLENKPDKGNKGTGN